jgi:hypothetical protein
MLVTRNPEEKPLIFPRLVEVRMIKRELFFLNSKKIETELFLLKSEKINRNRF